MRTKIIAVNAVIVLIVGLLSFFLMRSAATGAAQNPRVLLDEAKHDVGGASARLQLDGLRVERWLASKAAEAPTADAATTTMTQADQTQAGRSATTLCDQLLAASKSAPAFQSLTPSVVMLVDPSGKIKGRSGSDQERGQDLGSIYPGFKASLEKGQSGSDVWTAKQRNDQFLTSWAIVRNDKGVIGALVAGVSLADELSRVSEATTGRALIVTSADGSVQARSATSNAALDDALAKDGKDAVKNAAASRQTASMQAGEIMVGVAPLDFGDGKSSVLVAAAPGALFEGASGLPMSILGVMVLGIILVVVGGWLLGGYITAPIQTLEEGLLAILNGQTDKRFELDHAELGGLGFRIDQLLNQLMGIEEDTTDSEGRVSKAPDAATFASMSVDESQPSLDPGAAAALAAEPAQQYYGRIYREYVSQKRALGEQIDHVTEQAFFAKVQAMEQEAAQKQGRPVRFQIQTRGREVMFIPVTLG